MVAANHIADDAMDGRHCDDRTLQSLLDETIDGAQQSHAEKHLSKCVTCQRRLESLVGDETLWIETRTIYAETQSTHPRTNDQAGAANPCRGGDDATVTWLRSIVATSQSEDPNCIGFVNRYRIDSIVGTGGMGVVTAGYDPQLSRPVAIKFLAPHLVPMAPARRRFAREARAAAAIVHPSIMPIYGVSESSHVPFIVMPLIGSDHSARSLQDKINREGQLDLETALSVAAQIAEGLAAAHERGVVHRDIKPGNILLEENSPRILISDFGLARAIDDATVTVSGMMAGTPQYMSPEQAAGEDAGALSDVFSLGCVLYAMLTARPPFVAESPIVVLRKIIDTPVKPATQRMETLPPWVDRLLDQLLAKSPQDRIVSAAAAAKLLRECESHVRHPSAHELPETLRQRPVNPIHRISNSWDLSRQRVLLMLVCAMVSIAVMFWAFGHNPASDFSEWSQESSPSNSQASDAGSAQIAVSQDAVSGNVELSWDWPDFTHDADAIGREIDSIEMEFQMGIIP